MSSLGFSVPLALTLAAALALVVGMAGRRGRGGLASRPVWANIALLASVAGIVALTLNPSGEDNDIQLIPLRDFVDALTSPVNETVLLAAVANVLLFMPFGAALNMRGLSLKKTALVGFALTACVEGAQLLFVSGRTTSVDDLLLNTLGAVLGHALLQSWAPARKAPRSDLI